MIGIEELEAVNRVMKRGILSDYKGNWSDKFYGGEEIQALEKEWSIHVQKNYECIACNSATSGLYACLGAIGLEQGDEVLVTPLSMTCSASLPVLFGAKPVFVDVEPNYFCMDPDKIEEKITEKTVAIIVVNLFGHPYEAKKINAIAKKFGLYVIEDSAQAPMSTYHGKMCGTLGDFGVFSLNYHKHIHGGEGGIVVCGNRDLALRVRLMINHAEAIVNGMNSVNFEGNFGCYKNMVGMNLRMTELSAAIIREQLKKLPGYIEQYQAYGHLLNIKVADGCTSSFYRYAILDPDDRDVYEFNPNPDKFLAKKHYITPINRMPYFRYNGYDQECCPVADYVNDHIIQIWLKEPL